MNAPFGNLPTRLPEEWGLSIHINEDPTTDSRERELEGHLRDFAAACYSGDEARLSAAFGVLFRFTDRAEPVCDALTDLLDAQTDLAEADDSANAVFLIERSVFAWNKVLGLLGIVEDM